MSERRLGRVAAGAFGAVVAVLPCLAALAQPAGGDRMTRWSGRDLGAEWLTFELVGELFPGAGQVEDVAPLSGDPPSAAVYADGALAGYVFVTIDATPSLGFASTPFLIAVGLRLDGTLGAVRILEHREPIIDLYVLADRVPSFVAAYPGIDIREPHRVTSVDTGQEGTIDAISAATISAVLFNEAILNAARLVARQRGLGVDDGPAVDLTRYREASFRALVADGSIARLRAPEDAAGAPDLHFAPVTPPTIGRSILGKTKYNLFVSGRDPGDLMLVLMARGPWRFDPHPFRLGGDLERVRVVQNGKRFALSRERYRYLNFLRGDAMPAFDQIGLYWIESAEGIDPLAPWRLEAAMTGADGAETVVGADYRLAEDYILRPAAGAPAAGPSWLAAWRAQAGNLAILGVLLAALTAVLVFMRPLTRRPRLYTALRLGFLAFVLVWLGWIAGAQVTILNVLTWLRAVVGDFSIGVFMADPLIAVLVAFVAVTFVVWGRGIFCGWLCPFGALQELLAKAARALRIPPVALGARANRALLPVKYIVLAVLVAVSFHSMAAAGIAAEVEPFKTVISLGFVRDWPYVVYAGALLAAGLFVERFFCRFLCPLGAAMAIGGKLRLRRLVFLPRRAECGSPCQLCARKCPVQAIRPDGAIDMDECFYCLDCQVVHQDAAACPPLVAAGRGRVLAGARAAVA